MTKNINLKYLYCRYNHLTKLNVTKNIKLIDLYCNHNQLKELELDTSKNVNLIYYSSNIFSGGWE